MELWSIPSPSMIFFFAVKNELGSAPTDQIQVVAPFFTTPTNTPYACKLHLGNANMKAIKVQDELNWRPRCIPKPWFERGGLGPMIRVRVED